MAEATQGTPTIDYEKLGAAVAASLKPALVEANKPLLDSLTALQQAATATPAGEGAKAGTDAGAKPLTADDIKVLVTSTVTDALKAHTTGQQQTQARQSYQADKLKDLPVAYRNQLGSDPAKWKDEEQAIREQYKADVKISGGRTTDVGGDKGAGGAGGQKPADTLDLTKLTPTQLIAQGLKNTTPQGPAAAASTRTMQAAAAAK